MSHLPKRSHEHVCEMLQDISAAAEQGKRKLLRHRVSRFFQSHDARRVAILQAYSGLPLVRRPKVDLNVDELAERLDPARPCTEAVRVSVQPKGQPGAGDYRIIMGFGLENRSRQMLLKEALRAAARLHPHQYGTIGAQAAVSRVTKLMSHGHVWGAELDLRRCFQSFKNGEKLVDFLPVSKEVIRHTVMADGLTLTVGNLYDTFGPAENGVDPVTVTDFLSEARLGIPTGSAASTIVAEIVLSHALKQLPKLGEWIGYMDNTLFLATSKKDAVSMVEAYRSAVQAIPVGLFWPKVKEVFEPGQPSNTLGHRLRVVDGEIEIEPDLENRLKFQRKFSSDLLSLKTTKDELIRRRRLKRLNGYAKSWTASFRLCNGMHECRKIWLDRVQNAYANSSSQSPVKESI